jgi:hypothetical protein
MALMNGVPTLCASLFTLLPFIEPEEDKLFTGLNSGNQHVSLDRKARVECTAYHLIEINALYPPGGTTTLKLKILEWFSILFTLATQFSAPYGSNRIGLVLLNHESFTRCRVK